MKIKTRWVQVSTAVRSQCRNVWTTVAVRATVSPSMLTWLNSLQPAGHTFPLTTCSITMSTHNREPTSIDSPIDVSTRLQVLTSNNHICRTFVHGSSVAYQIWFNWWESKSQYRNTEIWQFGQNWGFQQFFMQLWQFILIKLKFQIEHHTAWSSAFLPSSSLPSPCFYFLLLPYTFFPSFPLPPLLPFSGTEWVSPCWVLLKVL